MGKLSKKQAPLRKDDPEQSKAFVEKAKEIGADTNTSRADSLMERLAKTPPKPKGKSAR